MKIDSNVHVYEYLIGCTGRGEARALGCGWVRYVTGEEEQVQPAVLGDKGLIVETYIDTFMKPYGIDKAVLNHALVYGPQNSYYADIAAKYPDKFIVTCTVDPFAAYKTDILEWLMAKKCYKAFQYDLSMDHGWTGWQPTLRIDGKEFDDIYAVAKEKKMAVSFYMGEPGQLGYQPEALANAAKANPELNFVCASLLNPDQVDRLDEVAACENVWFDVSRIPMVAESPEEAVRFIEYAVERVGSKRIMWGSNTPGAFVDNDYADVEGYVRLSTKLTQEDLDNIYGNSAAACYGI